MRNLLIVLVAFISLTIMSFTSKPALEESTVTSGFYGDTKIGLTINENNTFHYVNHMNPKKPVDVTGNWVLKGKMIVLKDYESKYIIADHWKIDNTYPCLRSTFKNFQVVRLCMD